MKSCLSQETRSVLSKMTVLGPRIRYINRSAFVITVGLVLLSQTKLGLIRVGLNFRAASFLLSWILVGAVHATPTLSFDAPANNATYTAPANVVMTATASCGPGAFNVSGLRFYNHVGTVDTDISGNLVAGTTGCGPFTKSFTWTGVAAGTYTIIAKSRDDSTSGTAQATKTITFTVNPNVAPSVALMSPANGAVSNAPADVMLTATATDTGGGTVSKVEFFNGANLIGVANATGSTYSLAWNGVGAGSYSISAKATDNGGLATTSTAASFIVNALPVATLTSPAAGATYIGPASINLSATASDSDGSVSKVEFYNGATLLQSLTSAPFNWTWSNVPVGSYTITAKATDNRNAVTTSNSATITVNPTVPPTVSITSPANGVIYANAPANVQITASASDSDGTVSKVEFFNGASLIGQGTVNGSTYSFVWSNVSPGTYSISAKATDNSSATTSSGPVSITVNAPPVLALTSPANNSTYSSATDINLVAAASDSDGSISSVKFYSGATLLGQGVANGNNYTLVWKNVPAGTYSITAQASDNLNAITMSSVAVVNVVFNAPATSTSAGPAGSTVGNLVVGQSGAANYEIPISVPPGTAGMAPKISLGYNSRGGNDLVGVGWNLSGFSVIARCQQTIAQDGVRRAVRLDMSDQFCLDGQRLIAVAGNYGADGTEYRTEIESFTRVYSFGSAGNGPAWFRAQSKSGQIIEYGNTSDSRIEAVGLPTVLTWAANKVLDTKGNYYTITYNEDTASGQYYPLRVDYTGNASITPVMAPYNSIQFLYDSTRTDIESGYVSGTLVSTTARLKNIQTLAGANIVRDYRLIYESGFATGRSRLTSITECDGSATPQCLPPTQFAWQERIPGLSAAAFNSPASSSVDWGYDNGRAWVDFDGDGKPDFCRVIGSTNNVDSKVACALTGTGGLDAVEVYSGVIDWGDDTDARAWVDVNGDGKADYCRTVANTVRCLISTGSGFASNEIVSPTINIGPNTHAWIDVNGDGLVDFCRTTSLTSMSCLLSTPTGFGVDLVMGAVDSVNEQSPQWADVVGDGTLAYCRITAGALKCSPFSSTGFGLAITSAPLDVGVAEGRAWADVNGDGKADFCRVTAAGAYSTGIIVCTFSSGTGFGSSISSGVIDVGWPGNTRVWLDFNGDGKADFCRISGQDTSFPVANCTMSTGSGFGSTSSSPIVDAGNPTGRVWIDINGDGALDYCRRSSVAGALPTLLCATGIGPVPDLLTSATNGLGATTSVTYKPLTDSTVYYKDPSDNPVYPAVESRSAGNVVSSISSSNGVGGLFQASYLYSGNKRNQQGRGSLGFAWARKTDLQSGISAQTNFRQDYPYIGMTASETRYTGNAILLQETVNTHSSIALGGTRYLPMLLQQRIKAWDLNGAFLSWTSVANTFGDGFGNLTQMKVQTLDVNGNADGYSKTLNSIYRNDTANWILGLPVCTKETSEMPGASPLIRTTALSYDPFGLLAQTIVEPNTIDPANSGCTPTQTDARFKLITRNDYDGFGNKTTVTVQSDANSAVSPNILTRITTVDYRDADGSYSQGKGRFARVVTNPLGHAETRVFDSRFGVLASLVGPNNLAPTTWTYDGFGRVLTESRADGTRATTSYSRCVNCWGNSQIVVASTNTVIASGANVSPPSSRYLDSLGRPILSVATSFDGSPAYQETRYDARGRIDRTSLSFFGGASVYWSTFAYDDLNRTLTESPPDGNATTYAYNGLNTSVTNAKGQVTTTLKNSQGQVVLVTNASGTPRSSTVAYAYDAVGRLLKTTDAAGNSVRMEYDILGRKTSLSDPDMGSWTYSYDVLGQLSSQTDAKGQLTTNTYDQLGRMTSRTEPDLVSNWTYDNCTAGKGKLCQAVASNGYSRVQNYDGLGRPSITSTTVGSTYSATTTYDSAGRPSSVTYPTGFAIQSNFNAAGYLNEIRNSATNALYWQAISQNASGQITAQSYGNGIVTTRTFDNLNGRLTQIQSGSGNAVQNLAIHYDAIGNVDGRTDFTQSLIETFGYDELTRLTLTGGSTGAVALPTRSIDYNAIGNITNKSGIGAYGYPAAGAVRPHAVASITGTVNGVVNPSFSYDANGNLISGAGRTLSWTSFNMPGTVIQGANSDTFLYGPEHQRIKETRQDGSYVLFFGLGGGEPQYERKVNGSTWEYRYYLPGMLGQVTEDQNSARTTRYFHKDNLGSVSVITNDAGVVMERLSYDAWGKRRNADGTDAAAAIASSVDRGYTEHEMMDNVGLVHMNGRIYDPVASRFMSADPTVQAPGNSQSYSRYSYVWNNPLTLTDPSGYAAAVTPGLVRRRAGYVDEASPRGVFDAAFAEAIADQEAWHDAQAAGFYRNGMPLLSNRNWSGQQDFAMASALFRIAADNARLFADMQKVSESRSNDDQASSKSTDGVPIGTGIANSAVADGCPGSCVENPLLVKVKDSVPNGGTGPAACIQAFSVCQGYAEVIHDRGYVAASFTLYQTCRYTADLCASNVAKSNPIAQFDTIFPPNASGTVVASAFWLPPIYVPNPLAGQEFLLKFPPIIKRPGT